MTDKCGHFLNRKGKRGLLNEQKRYGVAKAMPMVDKLLTGNVHVCLILL